MKDITSTITKPLAVLGENGKGYTKEANFISWNGNAAKLDIREWPEPRTLRQGYHAHGGRGQKSLRSTQGNL